MLFPLVKFCEEFRPFAPSVPSERADDYFHIHDPILFMTSVCKVKESGIRLLPRHAVRCFYSTGMDALGIGSCLLTKPGVDEPVRDS